MPKGSAYTIGETGANVNGFHKYFVEFPTAAVQIIRNFVLLDQTLVRSEALMVKFRVLPETKVGV